MPSFAEVLANSISNSTPPPDCWIVRLESFLIYHGAWSILIFIGICFILSVLAYCFYRLLGCLKELFKEYVFELVQSQVEQEFKDNCNKKKLQLKK